MLVNLVAFISALAPVSDLPVHDIPFCHVSYRESATAHLAAQNSQLQFRTFRRESDTKDGASGPVPRATAIAKTNRAATKSRRRGVLLYYAKGGMRTLPQGVLPLVGGYLGIEPPPLPHRAVWYSVLRPNESLEKWLANYTREANGGHARYRSIYDPEFPERATIRVTYPSPLPAIDNIWPAEEYRAFSSIQPTRDHVASVRQVRGVVFIAHFPELAKLKLDEFARSVERERSDWLFSIKPVGLPRKQLTELLARVRQLAEPRLQQRDEEANTAYRARTLGRLWLLDVLQLIATDLKSVSVEVNDILDQQKPFRVRLNVQGNKGTARRVLGTQIPRLQRVPQFSPSKTERRLGGFSYAGRLPQAIQESLLNLIGTIEDQALRDSVNAFAENSQLPVAVEFVQRDDQFLIVGAVACEQAGAIVAAARRLNQTESIITMRLRGKDSVVPKTGLIPSGPSQMAFTSSGDRLVFAFGDRDVEDALRSASSRLSKRSHNVFVGCDLDLAHLSRAKHDKGFDGWPAALLDLVEEQAFRLGVLKSNKLTMKSLQIMMGFAEGSLPSDKPDDERYLKYLEDYHRRKYPVFDPATTRRAVLADDKSAFHFEVSSTPASVSVDLELGRKAYRFFVGQFFEADRTLRRSSASPK